MTAVLRPRMRTGARLLYWSMGALICASALSCGGGGGRGLAAAPPGGGPSDANVTSVTVDAGPDGGSVNTLFTSVTVCVPGSSTNCQTIDHVEVDTASFGLRLLRSAFTLNLPLQTATGGNSLAECTVFADGYSWGPVAAADVRIGGESASSVPIQVIGDPGFAQVPADCSGAGATEEDSVATFGANGILGIGVFNQDCGPVCVTTAEPQFYYSCSAAQCQATTVPLEAQVTNPVTLFATDNNGSLIELPSVPPSGAPTVTGTLTFGIDTQANNESGSETVLTVDPNYGYLTVVYGGAPLNQSFVDTGSNAIFFNDANVPQCTDTNYTDFYCPGTVQNLSATLQGNNGVSAAVNFSVGNAQQMTTNSPAFNAFPQLAGPLPLTAAFDFGLPFYYGRRVATVLESRSTSAGTGPYVAF
jgi:hypothetical protein